jgi:hypothetical protein
VTAYPKNEVGAPASGINLQCKSSDAPGRSPLTRYLNNGLSCHGISNYAAPGSTFKSLRIFFCRSSLAMNASSPGRLTKPFSMTIIRVMAVQRTYDIVYMSEKEVEP